MSRRYRGKIVQHRSSFEDKVIADLNKRGIEYEYEKTTFTYQRPVRRARCSVCDSRDVRVVRKYTPDLKIKANGHFIELKGKFTSENRGQMEDFLRGSPGIVLKFLFMRDNWVTKNHKQKYSDWAKKHGCEYAIGVRIPDEWTIPISSK